ncbi:vitellogenin-1 precursor [Alligator mississippiensis]|uniref:Vitellogenin-1 n=1 Tax=Alligator mississippiensis TaxID=8496 RepID=A0A151NJ44_ALLMI|nr:vitellogenin-1 precursor [Alligator mississippiensis]
MRGITLALVLTLVGCQKYDIDPNFSKSKTCVYNYEGLIMHGLQERGLAKAGLRITSKLEISSLTDNTYLLKVRSPQLEEYNGIWPRDPFTRSSRLTQMITLCLSRPFTFEYYSGRIGNVYAPEDCPVLCINIMRGILNMMHITIKKSQNVYDLQEAGIEGICHTRYVIQEDRKNNRVSITKTKDLSNCQDKVMKNIGMSYIRPFPSFPVKEKIVKGTAAFTYKLKYAERGALITEAMSQQVYQISPFNEPAGVAVTEVRQELSLIEVRSEQVSPPEVQLQNSGSLRYDFPPVLPQMPIQLIKMRNPEQRIVETLQHIVQYNQQDFHSDVAYRFLELIQLSRVATVDNFDSLWKQFSDRPRYRRWLLSAISAAGTVDTVKFIKARLRSDDLNYIETLLTVSVTLHLIKADEHIMPVAADLVTTSRIQRNPMLRKFAYMAYSSLVNRYCSMSSSCPNEVLQPLHDLAAEALSRGREEDMTLALKAIGNAGVPASIKRILKFLPVFSSSASDIPVYVQVDAVMALRKIVQKDFKQGLDILIRLFMDRSLSPEVRMIACVTIFEARPALPLITTMANMMLSETNLQVASFLYSHMKALSKSRTPYLYNISSACNIALKLLSPKLDRLSYRYSKVVCASAYFGEYRAGAIGNVYLMNSPKTMFPSSIISNLEVHYDGAIADLLEVGIRAEGLMDIVRKKNIPFAEYSTYKKIKELGKTLLGWKELPPENPLLSAYVKLFGQELAFTNINKNLLEQAAKTLREPTDRQAVVKKIIQQIRNGIAGQWTQPVFSGEIRHIIPTSVGLPLEYALYSTALARAAVNVNVKMSPGDFRPSQWTESSMQIRADITPSLYAQAVAVMGTNTEYFQSAIEIQAKLQARAPVKFDATLDMKEKNFKFETAPCREETEIITGRHEAFAVSRNIGEPGAEKKIPVLPENAVKNILEEPFKSSERTSKEASWTQRGVSDIPAKKYFYGSEEDLHHSTGRRTRAQAICIKMSRFGCQLCFYRKTRDATFMKNTYLYKFIGVHNGQLVMKPVRTDAAIDRIQLEIQAGSRAASKVIQLVTPESEEEEEEDFSPDDEIQTKLKKILGIESVFRVGNRTHRHKKQKKQKIQTTDLQAETSAKHRSLSSSSPFTATSSSSSAAGGKIKNKEEGGTARQSKNKDAKRRKSSSATSSQDSSDSSSSSSGVTGSSSSSSDSSSSSSDSSGSSSSSSESRDSKVQGLPEIYQYRFKSARWQKYPKKTIPGGSTSNSSSSSSSTMEDTSKAASQLKFLGDKTSPVLAVILRAVQNDKKLAGFQLVVYSDWYSSRPRIQVFVSNITESGRWKLCADASVISSHKAAAYLKWGKDCRDYKISTEIVTGQFADHPAVQMKLEWPKVPSRVKAIAQWFYTFIPGTAYMLGFSEKTDKNPSQQAKMTVALTSPRTCDVVIKLPDIIIYDRAVRLPVPLPLGPSIPSSEVQSPSWNVFAAAPFAILETLKAHCSVSDNNITTFNGVEFNYSMPANCYHILAQDCSPELKFLVMIKNPEESDLKEMNIKLGHHELDMYPESGIIKLRVNGVETPVANISYTTDSGASVTVNSEEEGISLVAPDYGIDKLYFDGHEFKVQVALWMAGKICGICGKYDAENEEEYRTPSGSIAKDSVSFAHSWILSEDRCDGTCKLQRSLVKLEKTIRLEGENSKCYSTEHVLQCVKGCTPTETTPVTVGFHCVPADSVSNLLEGQMKFDQKSEDTEEVVEAHTACSCRDLHC